MNTVIVQERRKMKGKERDMGMGTKINRRRMDDDRN